MPSSQSRTQKAWASVVRHAKEHHESVNAAYTTYYGIPKPAASASDRPKSPASSASSGSSAKERSSLDKVWGRVKNHAKEHHASVNAAYSAYYGTLNPTPRR
ncbi:hypothetical protein GQ53DRAFT_101456 [Thozetella sp. PMI_491]|nr:hypothetical protein GQ53DRAFT_101456 [Thozetella sp. PMI_491]